MYIHRGCGGKLFVECTFWLVKAEPLIRSRVALRIYVQPIRILFLILMNVLEVKVRIAATESMTFADIDLYRKSCSQDSVLNVGKMVFATYHLNNGEAKRGLNVFVGD